MKIRIPGKKVGSYLYIHKSALPEIDYKTQLLIKKTSRYLPETFEYEVLKISKQTQSVSFIQSPDWNESDEPMVGDSIKITPAGETTYRKGRKENPQIYHHKWMMVDDHYKGFDVERSKARSKMWQSTKIKYDKKKIGNLNYWEKFISQVEYNEIRCDRTSIKQVPALFKNEQFELGPVNLDIGGGKYDLGTEYLMVKGITNYVYDVYSRDFFHNETILQCIKETSVDTVSVVNVLNTIKSEEERKAVISQAATSVKPDGCCFFQIFEGNKSGIPTLTTKRTWQANRKTETFIDEVSVFFSMVERKGNVLICRHPIKCQSKENLKQWTYDSDLDAFIIEGYLHYEKEANRDRNETTNARSSGSGVSEDER